MSKPSDVLLYGASLLLAAVTDAAAEGERTPMLGASAIGAFDAGDDRPTEMVGFALEGAWWWGRFGLAAEGSMRWDAAGERGRASVLGGSARLRVADWLVPSLLEPRDVELAIEVHAIVQRTWWSDAPAGDDPDGRGLGIALRIRGGSDDDFSMLLAESRLFVRVISSDGFADTLTARQRSMPAAPRDRELTVIIGLGAAFGVGDPGYVDRFRARPLDTLHLIR